MENTDVKDLAPASLQSALAALSPKERGAVKGVIEGKTKTQAMIDAGYSETTAVKRQQLVFGRERVQDAFVAAFESQGLSADRLAKIIEEGLEATRTLGNNKEGTSHPVPDYSIRHRYLETVLKVMGAFAPQKHEDVTETHEDRILRMMADQAIDDAVERGDR
jgi:hypothetical protein